MPGIIGLVEVVKEAYVDHTQFDRKDAHYDPKSSKENPKWSMVDVKYVRPLKRYIPLQELKDYHIEHKASKGSKFKILKHAFSLPDFHCRSSCQPGDVHQSKTERTAHLG